MQSYASNYGSPSRASRVDTPSRALSRLEKLDNLSATPRFVLINRKVDHIGVDYGNAYDIRTADNAVPTRGRFKTLSGGLDLGDASYSERAYERQWDARPAIRTLPSGLTSDEGAQWAVLMDSDWAAYIALTSSFASPLHVQLDNGSMARAWDNHPAKLSIETYKIYGPSSAPLLLWNESFDVPGCGAIGANHRIVMALQDGRLTVFDGDKAAPSLPGASHSSGQRLVETKLSFSPYDMSIVPSGYALLQVGAAIPDPRPYSDLERTLVLQARRVELSTTPPPRWKTVVHHLDLQGKETWNAEVPFEVLQPPIDGSEGRIYVMGMGAAAFQDGKLLFATPSALPMFGTAFQDGTLAVAVGPELRIVDRDGQIRQRFSTAEHEPITTPPAIGSDGSVWVGSATALYVAR